MLQFVSCECDVVKDTGKEEYLRSFIHVGLDWIAPPFIDSEGVNLETSNLVY